MTDPKITVAIPVGPYPHDQRWLAEAIDSVRAQTYPASEILLVDDMANVVIERGDVRVWRSPWRLGIGGAFNCGVALAEHDLVFLLCADDWLSPACLEECVAAYERNGRRDGYYWVVAHYFGEKEGRFDTPCNYAMVTKGFWRETGGFPVEAVIGQDFMFMQVCGRLGFADGIIPVSDEPLYHLRIHPETATAQSMPRRRMAKEMALARGEDSFAAMLREYCVLAWRTPQDWGRRE